MNYQHFVTVFLFVGSVLLWHYYYSLIYFHLYCSFIWLLVIFWTHYFWMKHAYVRTKNHKHRQQFSFSSLVRLNEFSYHTIPFEWIIALNRIDRWSKNGKKMRRETVRHKFVKSTSRSICDYHLFRERERARHNSNTEPIILALPLRHSTRNTHQLLNRF